MVLPKDGLRELALFAGAGGGILGGMLHGWRTVCAVEIEDYPRRVLLQRQADGVLPRFPIWDDVCSFDGKPWRGKVDVVSGGFPCQPFSYEGKRDWNNDKRNLWPQTKRIIDEVKPKFVFLENVQGVRNYLPCIIRDLRRIGYTVEKPITVSAADTGALHIRKRVWIFAYANGERWSRERNGLPSEKRQGTQAWVELEGLVQDILQSCIPASRGAGIHDGVSDRMGRLKAIGNGQVPAVAATAWEILSNEKNKNQAIENGFSKTRTDCNYRNHCCGYWEDEMIYDDFECPKCKQTICDLDHAQGVNVTCPVCKVEMTKLITAGTGHVRTYVNDPKPPRG